MVLAAVRIVRGSFPPVARDFTDVRLTLARLLAIAGHFSLAPISFPGGGSELGGKIGKLAAIAVIRTNLDYFLSRDMQEEHPGTASP